MLKLNITKKHLPYYRFLLPLDFIFTTLYPHKETTSGEGIFFNIFASTPHKYVTLPTNKITKCFKINQHDKRGHAIKYWMKDNYLDADLPNIYHFKERIMKIVIF